MDKMLGIGLIGAGRAGMIHALNFKNKVSGAYMSVVVDADEATAKNAADILNVEHYETDYRKILSSPEIDAVIVVAPTNLHCQIVTEFAKAGKHIFCEKPMAMNTRECDEMIKVCAENNVKLQIGFMRRFDTSFIEAKNLLEQGAIGTLVQVHSCTRGPSKPHMWMYDLKKSNGILAEVNSHDIDSLRWITQSDVDTLYAVAGNFRNPEVADEFPDYYDSVLMNGT
ncbi:MAG: Gfo/Idh/MocA family oxidoreductase, partial [Oscillospiraceae bacterium]